MITKFNDYNNSSFSNTKNWLIDIIQNKKGFVKMNKIKDKYINYLNLIDDFSEENQTIEKKELTQIKNTFDKLYGIFYGTIADKYEIKDNLNKIAKNKGFEHLYGVKDPELQVLNYVFSYSLADSKRTLDKFNSVNFNIEEENHVKKYYPDLDKWTELYLKIKEIKKILNPTKEEREKKKLQEIKGKINPKIKNAIDEIAEDFRKVIEKNEYNLYKNTIERYIKKFGKILSYDQIRKSHIIIFKVYKKNYTLIPNWEEVIKEESNKISYEIIQSFQFKMYDKIGGMISDINKDFDVEVKGEMSTNNITFTFNDGSEFSIKNQIVSKFSNMGTFFYTYPTTFHDAYLPDGEKIQNPNEYNVKKSFNDYYNKK